MSDIITRSLDTYRCEQLLDIREFAAQIGLIEQTYCRLLQGPEIVCMRTKRRGRDWPVVFPFRIVERTPTPFLLLLAQAQAPYDAAHVQQGRYRQSLAALH